MPSKIFSATIIGLDSQIIEVETDVSYGLKNFNIVGLPDKSIEESKERVSVAIKNSGLISPLSQPQRILINLAPADLKKEGSLYDLPIALGYLLSSKQTKFSSKEKIFVGELSLDGRLKPIKGALAIALTAQKKGFKEFILPKINAPEAALIYLNKKINDNDFKILGVESLKEVINYLENRIEIKPTKFENENILKDVSYSFNFDLIKGQESAKRALEIAAAGGHNVFFNGPPGTGKSLLARSLPSILPNLSFQESLEVTKIHSIAGLLPENKPLINTRPFRSPHHSASESALIGGGNPLKPGEITLSHRGVLFLDEFPEFHRDVLESLRQPLEEGEITILRAKERITFPARFILIAAANPCPANHHKLQNIEENFLVP
jgi:magnesium chelatase family protein